MDLKKTVESAEIQLKHILERFFISNYDEDSLPSHGIDHHRRVWKNASELLLLLAEHDLVAGERLPYNLIIASYLHDIGMSVDRGVRHGNHSRNLCNRFLSENNLDPLEYEEVLDAIENHDNKEYRTISGGYNLLTILSVADDLDAFGFSGIFRYAEIYLARGIEIQNLGPLIQTNAAVRFENFVLTFGSMDKLVNEQRARWEILNRFYDEFNSMAASYAFATDSPHGYCGVIEIFVKMLENRKTLKDIIDENRYRTDDSVIRWFFNGLAEEIF